MCSESSNSAKAAALLPTARLHCQRSFKNGLLSRPNNVNASGTRSSAIAERPRDTSCC